MTPDWKLLINFCPKSAFQPRCTCLSQIWRKSTIAKLSKSRLVLLTKKTSVGDTSEPPISPPLSRSRPKFRERCRPLSCACVPTLVRIGCGLPDLCRKESKKSQYNIGYNNLCYCISEIYRETSLILTGQTFSCHMFNYNIVMINSTYFAQLKLELNALAADRWWGKCPTPCKKGGGNVRGNIGGYRVGAKMSFLCGFYVVKGRILPFFTGKRHRR